ncbi:MAG: hypothetical protein JXC31_02540 [Acholeplasmataceae bacterium]|nr:hypothetical protein [Acholeplasmataceae bacterium]
MNQIKNLRKLAVFVLISASLLTLAACNNTEAVPYGSITDATYMTVGDETVTEKSLYDQLRLQGASILSAMIHEQVYADELSTIAQLLASGDEELNAFLDETVNSAIHGTSDTDNLDELYTDSPDIWSRDIEAYADSLYLLDNTIDIDQVIADLENLGATQDNAYSGYSSISLIEKRYSLNLAQRYFAQQILDAAVIDATTTDFIGPEDVLTYYQDNYLDHYDVEALVIRFINLNEANAALYMMGLKADSKGLWYKIPDIRILPGETGYIDLTDETPQSGYKHVKDILETLGILGKLGDDFEERANISVSDYENYYKSYVISTNRSDGLSDEALTTAQVKAEFVDIYNVLNPASQVEIAVDGSIVGTLGSEFTSNYTYDDLTAINTSLRSHIYTTLLSEASMTDPDDTVDGMPYSSRVQTFGTSRYLVFKLSDDSADEDLVYDSLLEAFTDTTESLALQAEITAEIKDAKLTNAYITSKISEAYDETELNIYDGVVRSFYEQSYGYSGSTKNKAGDVLAELGDIQITVDAFYERLEKTFGINLALDLGSNLYLANNSDYVVSDEDLEDYQSQFEDIISQFSADNFASNGYPASMGRQDFLLLAFGARTNAEAVNQLFVYPNLREQYLNDVEAHYGSTTETIYEKLAQLAELQYDYYKSINVSHLLVYFDKNGDGTPDDPQEYLDTLSTAGADQVIAGLTELVQLVYSKVGNYTGMAAGLSAIATEFNNSGRIVTGSVTPPYDYQIEQIWAEYRQLGFYLKYESLSGEITNTSNLITGSTTLDEVFYDRAIQLHDELQAMADNTSNLPYLDLYEGVITASALDEVKSAFGWHLILATSIKEKSSAIYSEADDEDGKYVNSDGTLNAYNETSEILTASQIEYYITENNTDEGAVVPTVVQTSINNYLTPVLTRYEGQYMQRELIFKLMAGVEFEDSLDMARFNTIREINMRQLNDYMNSSTGYFDQNYDDLYGSWFDILEN